ncbi:SDR family oxidoreductase [Bacteroidota bacterium]
MNIIVTGASRGIGYEVARKFAKDNSNTVLVISRNEEKLTELRQECLRASPKARLIVLPFDLEKLEGNEGSLREDILKNFKSIDILINNAGLLIKKPAMDLTSKDVNRMMSVNFLAPLLMARTLMPLLERAGIAHVVNIGSMAGMQGGKKFPGLSAYSSSKAAVHVLTECLAEEYKEGGVRFNALAFGAVKTEMLAEAFPGLEAPIKASEMASFVQEFALNGHRYFNGKTLPVSVSTP